MSGVEGRTVLITGAGSGLGTGLAAAFAAAGANVVVTARREEPGREVVAAIEAAGGRAAFARCDVTREGDVEAAVAVAVDAFGGLDALVHNATSRRSSEPTDLEHTGLDLWDEHAAVSIRGAYRCARAGFARLRERGGCLLVLTSPAGIDGSAGLPFYAAVKGAQRAFVKSLAREWGPDGVRVNGLAPLAVTPALDRAFRADPDMEARLTALVPLGRFGDPASDIGPPAVFLCGDGARYVTGQNLIVSGGRLTHL